MYELWSTYSIPTPSMPIKRLYVNKQIMKKYSGLAEFLEKEKIKSLDLLQTYLINYIITLC